MLMLILIICIAYLNVYIWYVLLKRFRKKDVAVQQSILKDSEIKKISKYFVNQDEKYLSSLGNGYIMNYLANQSLSKGFAVISDKRVYFRGTCFSGTGKNLKKTDEERTVDVKDITGSGFIYRRYIGILLGLIAEIIFFIFTMSLLTFLSSKKAHLNNMDIEAVIDIETSEPMAIASATTGSVASGPLSIIICILSFAIVCLLAFLAYLKMRKTFFEIQYAGGRIAFDVSFYAKAEISDFQKQLRRAKDYVSENVISTNRKMTTLQAEATIHDTADDLRKYAELLKDGLISQEEYDTLKKKLLGL